MRVHRTLYPDKCSWHCHCHVLNIILASKTWVIISCHRVRLNSTFVHPSVCSVYMHGDRYHWCLVEIRRVFVLFYFTGYNWVNLLLQLFVPKMKLWDFIKNHFPFKLFEHIFSWHSVLLFFIEVLAIIGDGLSINNGLVQINWGFA